jgi:MutS domain V
VKAIETYQHELQQAELQIGHLETRLRTLIWVRTIVFFAAVFCIVFGYFGELAPTLTIPGGWLLVAIFFVAIVVNEHVRLSKLAAESDASLFQRLIARVQRQWAKIPPEKFLAEVTKPDCSEDLDVEGDSSLLSLLTLASTHPGQKELQQWIAQPPHWPEVIRRQNAAKALAPERELRIELIRRTSKTVYATSKPYGLTQWAESPSWLKQHPVAHLLSYMGPGILWLGLAIMLVGRTQSQELLIRIGFGGLVFGAALNILITVFWGSWIHDVFHRVCGEHNATRQYSVIFELLGRLPNNSELLNEIRAVAFEQRNCAVKGIASLNRFARLASMQRNIIFYLVYLALQQLFLWDFRVLKMLERWKQIYGGNVHQWFDALGKCEAIISTATLVDEHPDWCFPTPLSDPQICLQAQQLGHPLLSNQSRVNNDLRLSRDQPLLLVTGSNMAGKSTFMRALGINLLLARAGCVVCATQLSTDHYEIASSIRVRDSLRDGVSFFMAELKRLKSVVDMAIDHQASDKPPILFLLDEILQGTNSRERQIAVAHVVEQLVKYGTVGLLSTHDLDLAKVAEVARVAQIVHFREYFEVDQDGKQRMRFDYIMRPGPTPTTNALKLLEMVGLRQPSNSD